MSIVYKSKEQLRKESEKAIKKFVRSGGAIETIKPRKTPKSVMRSKSSRGFIAGTSGFAAGFPRKSFA